MEELSLADVEPTSQTITLSDSLDLSRLKCTTDQRELLANILADLAAKKIDCAHMVLLRPNLSATFFWTYLTSKSKEITLTLETGFNPAEPSCHITTDDKRQLITLDQLTALLQQFSARKKESIDL